MIESTREQKIEIQQKSPIQVIKTGENYKWRLHGEPGFLQYFPNLQGQSQVIKWTPSESNNIRFLRKDNPTINEVARFYSALNSDYAGTTDANNLKGILNRMAEEQEEIDRSTKQGLPEMHDEYGRSITISEGNPD